MFVNSTFQNPFENIPFPERNILYVEVDQGELAGRMSRNGEPGFFRKLWIGRRDWSNPNCVLIDEFHLTVTGN